MKPEKLELLEFAARVTNHQRRAKRLKDAELIERVRGDICRWFPVDSETLILIEELIDRFEKGKT